jgi:uncharacterized membrane protein YkvA (DUF1232 family)
VAFQQARSAEVDTGSVQERAHKKRQQILCERDLLRQSICANILTMSDDASFSDPFRAQLPAVIARNRRTVEKGFWKKLLRLAGRVPFAEELAAAWFCASDPETPLRVKGILFAALAYFVTPVDAIPDFVMGFGFTDDATVLATAIGLIANYMKDHHRAAARSALGRQGGS